MVLCPDEPVLFLPDYGDITGIIPTYLLMTTSLI